MMEFHVFEVEKQLTALIRRKKEVTLEEIPHALQEDFRFFFIGKTFTLRENIPHFHYNDFQEWFNKVVYREGITV